MNEAIVLYHNAASRRNYGEITEYCGSSSQLVDGTVKSSNRLSATVFVGGDVGCWFWIPGDGELATIGGDASSSVNTAYVTAAIHIITHVQESA